jgi:3-hydroxybutyryl-CoA dehydrogenase
MEINTIGVIGAGTRGREIAYLCAICGYKTILEAVSPELLEQSLLYVHQTLDGATSTATVTPQQKLQVLANLSTSRSVEDVCREADLLIEAAQEEMEVKLEIFTLFDKFARPNTILAGTSPTISIVELAEITFRGENCIGMRFGNPIPHNGSLQLIRTAETSDDTVQACTKVGQRMGKKLVVVRE